MVNDQTLEVFDNNIAMKEALFMAFEIRKKYPPVCIISMQYSESNPENKWLGGSNYDELAELVRNKVEKEGFVAVLYGTDSLSYLSKNLKFVDLLYKYKKVCFFKAPFILKEVLAEVKRLRELPNLKDELAERISVMSIKQDSASRLHHDICHRPNEIIAKVNKLYGTSYAPDTDPEIVREFLSKYRENPGNEFAGEFLKGVFCDVEGTLLASAETGEINKPALDKLLEFDKDSFITLWTGGDVEKLQRILEEKGINWKVLPKSIFSGATVEVAIDDLSADDLKKDYNISTQRFIRVSEL